MRGLKKIGPVDRHLATKLKKFRTEQGMGLEKLAEITGVSFQQIQKYEKAENKIAASKLFEVAHALNRPINAFFDGLKISGKYYNIKINSEKKRKKESDKLDKDLLPLIRSFNLIENKQLKRHIVNMMREVAGSHYRKKSKHLYS